MAVLTGAFEGPPAGSPPDFRFHARLLHKPQAMQHGFGPRNDASRHAHQAGSPHGDKQRDARKPMISAPPPGPSG